MLPLFPDSQHQMRAQGSVIKENVPDAKLSADFWKFLIKRALFAHPPQPLIWLLPVMLFFAPFSLLAAIWHKYQGISYSISLDSVERCGQPQGLCLAHHSTQLFRKQENMRQRRRNQQINKKLKWKIAEQIHKMKRKKKGGRRGRVQPSSKHSTIRSWGA